MTDDYRWLENYSDPAVRAWSDAENKYARKYLDGLPLRATLADELKRLADHPTLRYFHIYCTSGCPVRAESAAARGAAHAGDIEIRRRAGFRAHSCGSQQAGSNRRDVDGLLRSVH